MGDMNSGHLTQKVTLRQQTGTVRNESGALTVSETDSGPLWAAVDFQRAGSDGIFKGDQVTAKRAVNFTIRNSPERTVSAKDKIIYRGNHYEIVSVLEADGKASFLLLETHQVGENNKD